MHSEILELGIKDYKETWELQKKLREERRDGTRGDTLVLVEHPHVYTVGVQGSEEIPPLEGVPVYHVERGGKATYHGPGQIVGYPIVDLNPRAKDVRRFVHDLEEMVSLTLAPFGIQAQRVEGKRGVWVGDRKIASVGIAVQDWVTYHGFALNVSTDLTYFERIHPCGFEGKVMTSMEKQLQRHVDASEARESIKAEWVRLF